MGKTQNSPVHLPTFLQKNNDDPAIKVSRSVHLSSFFTLASLFRTFRRNCASTYFLASKRPFDKKQHLFQRMLDSERFSPILNTLKPMLMPLPAFSSRMIAFTTTSSRDSTSLRTTCGAAQTSSILALLGVTSCFLPMMLILQAVLQTCTVSYMRVSWVPIMRM